MIAYRQKILRVFFQSLTSPNFQRFHFYTNEILPESAPQFLVGSKNGFLPREPPLQGLPPYFEKMEEIMQKMPINLEHGGKGLLDTAQLGKVVESELPLYDVDNIENSALLHALMRDYTFLASGFLLENCHQSFLKTGDYCLGRDYLPKQIAVPLVKIADKLNLQPYMEYSTSYAVYNYKKVDPNGNLDAENISLIRRLEGSEDEIGFVAVHIAMVQHSKDQVKHTVGVMDAVEKKDREALNHEMQAMISTLQKMNQKMDTMWKFCKPERYDKFRTFIMGTKNQPMFPNGVIYKGVDEIPRYYRGESGANDSIIPTMDNLFEVTALLPQNPLTEILKDFRKYRPPNHQEWVKYVEHRAKQAGVRKFAIDDPVSALYYLANLDQISEFRERHWRFTKQYILRYSHHPVGTGGSPIVTWLPNQLKAVMKIIDETAEGINASKLSVSQREHLQELKNRAQQQREILVKEVDAIKKSYANQDL